jgi:hypothetical protein
MPASQAVRMTTDVNPIDDDFWSDRFYFCALVAGMMAKSDGRLADSEYVRRLAYDLYEDGAFREPVAEPADVA